jgi:hypothetical protein
MGFIACYAIGFFNLIIHLKTQITMKQIKFRAKMAGTDSWIFGLPYSVYGEVIDSIHCLETGQTEYIKTDTLCQLVCVRNEIEFYEHDILEDFLSIRWNEEDASYEFYWTYNLESCNGDINWYENEDIIKTEPIGNIFDNPELVE